MVAKLDVERCSVLVLWLSFRCQLSLEVSLGQEIRVQVLSLPWTTIFARKHIPLIETVLALPLHWKMLCNNRLSIAKDLFNYPIPNLGSGTR
jgi:hypothetical protein